MPPAGKGGGGRAPCSKAWPDLLSSSSNSLFPGDRQPPTQCRRQLSPPFVRKQPPERHRPPGVQQPQRAALAPVFHFHPRPRPVGDEARHPLRLAHLVADLV